MKLFTFPKQPAPLSPTAVVGKIVIEFMADDTFLIHWPQGEVGYLKAIGALHVAINDLYVRAAGIMVEAPDGEMKKIEDLQTEMEEPVK